MRLFETKLVFPDSTFAPEIFSFLERHVGGHHAHGPLKRSKIVDCYYDTPDYVLHSVGTCLRLRRHLTGPHELRWERKDLRPPAPVGGLSPDAPSPIPRRVQEYFMRSKRGHHVSSALTLLNQTSWASHKLRDLDARAMVHLWRKERLLTNKWGDQVRLCLDRFSSVADVDDATRSPSQPSFFQIEVKSECAARSGGGEAVFHLVDRLVAEFNLRVVHETKLERARTMASRQTRPRKIILDMDTGVDDAIALLVALRSPELEVLAVTSVGGNASAKQCALNTKRVLSWAYRHVRCEDERTKISRIQIGVGIDLQDHASEVHGRDGLGDLNWASLGIGRDELKLFGPSTDAQQLMKSLIRAYPDELTVVATGPLSNLGHLAASDSHAFGKIGGIVAMAGVFFEKGNRGPLAEANVVMNPAAARSVVAGRHLAAAARGRTFPRPGLTLVGLDVTHRVAVTPGDIDGLSSAACRSLLRPLLRKYFDFYFARHRMLGAPLHDPLALACAIDPSLITVESLPMDILENGITQADIRFPPSGFKTGVAPVGIAVGVDSERALALIMRRLDSY